MRKLLPLFAALFMAIAVAQTAQAQPAAPTPSGAGTGWRLVDGQPAWTSPTPLTGDAAVEFWSDGKLVGRARSSADSRTFSLPGKQLGDLSKVEVRAGGKRLDAPDKTFGPHRTPAALPPPQPAGAVDPGTPGQYQTVTGEYSLDSVKLPGYAQLIEMQAVVVAPKNAPGNRPLVLFLHGRHGTCYDPTNVNNQPFTWPCPAGTLSVPSYRGYLQTQQLLASQGYDTVSISVNGINAQDAETTDQGAQARSTLVRLHLAHWADWAGAGRVSAPQVVRDAPVADMSKVMLVGHSRGGEGVNQAALDSLAPPPFDTGYSGPVRWTIRGDVFIAPTIFGQNPTPDVPSVTFLPGCDGDVADLQGQQYVDSTRGVSRGKALHSALYIAGADHNFFNSEWTPGMAVAPAQDDYFAGGDPNPLCDPGQPARLTDAQQRAVGATYVAAAAHLFIDHDQRVQPLLDGSGVRAPSADPARVLSAALGANRTPVVVPDPTTKITGSGKLCDEINAASACLANSFKSPHELALTPAPTEAGRSAVDVRWSSAGTAAVIEPPKPVLLVGDQSLALRVIVPENSTGTSFDVAAVDANGHRTKLGKATVNGIPGVERTVSYWAQEVRVPVPPVLQVAKLELVPSTGSGEAWLLDAHGWRSGLPDLDPAHLTRVDVGQMSVPEGDSGSKNVQFPVTVTGDGGGALKVFQSDPTSRRWTEKALTLAPGQHTVSLSTTVVGNTGWSPDYLIGAIVKAAKGTVVGSYRGGVKVLNDDPAPKVTLTPSASVAAGGTLTWHVSLSAAVDVDVFFEGAIVAPTTGPELTTTDVDPAWLKSMGVDPLPSRPLSKAGFLEVFQRVPAGTTDVDLKLLTLAHNPPDPDKHVQLHVVTYPTGLGVDATLTGTVTGK
ncbi:alpha/beta hydrolase family protein [Kutzneria sp. CA-103260]|uniref:alpha/beta hydrolase family protein n=1 Tax=Kutzneria sp. CA-103260 TaxID=2802641 RepID=UPI001BA9777F|nr:hypothetical protein [Kutzneria sp. CA-103260]QUQ68042.1 hypothetical protein JJ691_57820 [Kutzneria sp. CA-103260]